MPLIRLYEARDLSILSIITGG